jgi:hypothetical protein
MHKNLFLASFGAIVFTRSVAVAADLSDLVLVVWTG